MEEYALILCGGGGRGAYQVGMWRALERLGLRRYITAVSGTSAGALNAALFATMTSTRAADIWKSITQQDIADTSDAAGRMLSSVLGFAASDNKGERLRGITSAGLFSRDGLIDIIEKNGVDRAVCSSDMPVFACCHNSTLGRPEYFDMRAFPREVVTRILIASSAIPAAFPPQRIGRYTYRDGGISDNAPVKPLYDIGYRRFIVSYLDSFALDRKPFPDAEFIELYPSDAIYLGDRNRSMLSDGTLDFDGKHAEKRIELGEQETAAFLMMLNSSRRKALPFSIDN